jgi:hypothetical protein
VSDKRDSDRRFWRRFFLSLNTNENVCRVLDDQGRIGRVRVVDISLGGARLKLAPEAGEREAALERFKELQELSFQDCEIEKWGRHLCGASGYVRWVSEDLECGCQFYSPLGASGTKSKK